MHVVPAWVEPAPSLLRSFIVILVTAVGAGMLPAAPAPLQRSSGIPSRPPDFDRLSEWIDAAGRHEPGVGDGAAVAISAWSREAVEGTLLDFVALVQVLLQPEKPRLPRQTRFTDIDVQALHSIAKQQRERLAPAAGTAADATATVNRLARRAALLHTDIALLLLSAADRAVPSPLRVLPMREQVMVSDGRQAGVGYGGVHWDVARFLLDASAPDPAKDPLVREWYHAIAAHMASRRMIAESGPHLARARQLFPADPQVQFASGALFEAIAAPRIQNFAQAGRSNGAVIDLPTERVSLRRAEAFFRRTLDLDGSFLEARLRLGRITGLMGRHLEAADILRRCARDANTPLMEYFTGLFLGAEEEALGHSVPAKLAYERAAAVWPVAQSPRLALSQLARRTGDRQGAIRAVQQVFDLPSVKEDREDPWWTYFEEPANRANSLVAEVRAALFLAER
jgi:hypothetical protein